MAVVVNHRIVIPDDEIEFTAIRASGPGGQHVNKTESALRLRFDAMRSPALDEATRARLRVLAGRRMTTAGEIVIVSQRFRSREANRQDALGRLIELVAAASVAPSTRHRTKPPRRVEREMRRIKMKRKTVKQFRARVRSDED